MCECCGMKLNSTFGLGQLLYNRVSKDLQLCETCQKGFAPITGKVCDGCGVPSLKRCANCVQWSKTGKKMLHNRSLYEYNEMMQWFFTEYKFNGGYHLRHIFENQIKSVIPAGKVVVIPVNEQTMQTRGFNQTLGLIEGVDNKPWLRCKAKSKLAQSKKTRQERLKTEQPFELAVAPEFLKDKKIILIDDVYTTGRTLYHAADLLYENGVNSVCSITMAR